MLPPTFLSYLALPGVSGLPGPRTGQPVEPQVDLSHGARSSPEDMEEAMTSLNVGTAPDLGRPGLRSTSKHYLFVQTIERAANDKLRPLKYLRLPLQA